jgi:hypothetical protein
MASIMSLKSVYQKNKGNKAFVLSLTGECEMVRWYIGGMLTGASGGAVACWGQQPVTTSFGLLSVWTGTLAVSYIILGVGSVQPYS